MQFTGANKTRAPIKLQRPPQGVSIKSIKQSRLFIAMSSFWEYVVRLARVNDCDP
jgi:hypothetical protein